MAWTPGCTVEGPHDSKDCIVAQPPGSLRSSQKREATSRERRRYSDAAFVGRGGREQRLDSIDE